MNKFIQATLLTSLLLNLSTALAFTKETHRRIAIDAVNYMQSHPDSTNFNQLKAAFNAAGYSVAEAAQVIGQGAFDVDDFEDTFLCGAITGDCVVAPVYGIGTDFVNYTAFHHFQDHTNGSDAHGNDLGGYNYSRLNVKGAIDDAAASWLWNDHLDDGRGGMTGTCVWAWGWRCAEDSEYNSYGITEENYREGSYNSKSMYDDFQNIPWHPIDNLGQHWYSEFLKTPTLQTLGFVFHTSDILQPHHTWNTLDLNHSGWESWVADHYYNEGLNDNALVQQAMSSFTPVSRYSKQIRPLLTQGGAISYQYGGIVLSQSDHATRKQVAEKVVPHAIAMLVHLLNHAAYQF